MGGCGVGTALGEGEGQGGVRLEMRADWGVRVGRAAGGLPCDCVRVGMRGAIGPTSKVGGLDGVGLRLKERDVVEEEVHLLRRLDRLDAVQRKSRLAATSAGPK